MPNSISDDDEQLWQHVFDELDSTIDIADQMANATDPMCHRLAHSSNSIIVRTWVLQDLRYNEIHLVPLTTENLALHNLLHGRTRWIIPSSDYYTSFEKGQHNARSTPHSSTNSWVSISSGPMEATHDDDWWSS